MSSCVGQVWFGDVWKVCDGRINTLRIRDLSQILYKAEDEAEYITRERVVNLLNTVRCGRRLCPKCGRERNKKSRRETNETSNRIAKLAE